MVWRLKKRVEREYGGKVFFYDQWVEPESKSGIVFMNGIDRKSCKIIYVVEGYGIGTVDPKTFKEIADGAPIEHFETESYEEAKRILEMLKEHNYRLAKGEDPEKLREEFKELYEKAYRFDEEAGTATSQA